MQNNLPNSFSRVIYKNFNDKNTKNMLNSYRYKNPSEFEYKKWSPEIAYQERFIKKREREDHYVANFSEKDRPVLVVKKKNGI